MGQYDAGSPPVCGSSLSPRQSSCPSGPCGPPPTRLTPAPCAGSRSAPPSPRHRSSCSPSCCRAGSARSPGTSAWSGCCAATGRWRSRRGPRPRARGRGAAAPRARARGARPAGGATAGLGRQHRDPRTARPRGAGAQPAPPATPLRGMAAQPRDPGERGAPRDRPARALARGPDPLPGGADLVRGRGAGHARRGRPPLAVAAAALPPQPLRGRRGAARVAHRRHPGAARRGSPGRAVPARPVRLAEDRHLAVRLRGAPVHDRLRRDAARRKEFTIKGIGDFSDLVAGLRPGRSVFLDGPHGSFTLDGLRSDRFVFIAGGVGITPMLSMLRTLADRGDTPAGAARRRGPHRRRPAPPRRPRAPRRSGSTSTSSRSSRSHRTTGTARWGGSPRRCSSGPCPQRRSTQVGSTTSSADPGPMVAAATRHHRRPRGARRRIHTELFDVV